MLFTAPAFSAPPSRKALDKAQKQRCEHVVKTSAHAEASKSKRKSPLRAIAEANCLPTAHTLSEWYVGVWEQTSEISTVYTP